MPVSGPSLRKAEGFTLIELLLAIVILSAGLVVIDQILLASVSALSYVDNRTEANRVLANKIWETQDQAYRLKKKFSAGGTGIVTGSEKTFNYSLEKTGAVSGGRLYPFKMSLRWDQTGKSKAISRSFFVWIPHEKKS